MARDCKKLRQPKRNRPITGAGIEGRPSDRINPSIGSVNTLGRKNGTATECVSMRSDISNGK